MGHFQFAFPNSCQCIGPSGSGKSELVANIIKHRNVLFDKAPHVVLYVHSGDPQPDLFAKLKSACPNIKFLQGLEPLEKITFNPAVRHLLCVDDLMTEVVRSKFMHNMFTRYSNHNNIFIFYIVQNAYVKGPYATDIARQPRYVILFRNRRDRTSTEMVARNTLGIKPKDIHSIMKMVAERNSHPYVLINCHNSVPDDMQIMSNLLPTEWPNIYYRINDDVRI